MTGRVNQSRSGNEKRASDRSFDEVPPSRKALVGMYLGSIAFNAVIGYGGVGALNYALEMSEPLKPSNVYESTVRIGRESLQQLRILKCANEPSASDTSQILNTSVLLNELRSEPDFDRFEIAESLGLTLVSQKDLDDVKKNLANTVDKYGDSSTWSDQITVIANKFMNDHFGLDYEYIPFDQTNGYPSDITPDNYAMDLSVLLDNLSALPTEIHDQNVFGRIVVNANGLNDTDATDGNIVVAGKFMSYGRTIHLSQQYMTNGFVLLHEIMHGVDVRICTRKIIFADPTSNTERVLQSLNPSGYEYAKKEWLDVIGNDKTIFFREYSQSNASEDMADAGASWILETDINKLDKDNLEIIDQKRMIAASWINKIAPHMAEYMSQISRQFILNE